MITKTKTLESKFVIMTPIFLDYPVGQIRPISRVSGTRVYYFTGMDYEKEQYTMSPMGFCDTQEEVDMLRAFSHRANQQIATVKKNIKEELNAFYTNVVTVG